MADVNAVESMLDEAAEDAAQDARKHPAPAGPQQPLALVSIILAQIGVHGAMAGTRMAAPLEALRAGYGPLAAGALIACFALAPVLLSLPAGRLADRHGYHRPMHLAVAMTVLGVLLSIAGTWLHGAWHVALQVGSALLAGAGANTAVLATQRTVGRAATNSVQRMRFFSWLGMAPALANAVGPVMVGLAIDWAGFGAGYGCMAALALLSLLMMRRVPREVMRPQRRDRSLSPWSLFKVPGFSRLLTVNWLISASWDVHSFAVPVIGHERGFSASMIGIILGVFTLSVTLVRFIIPTVAARLNEITVLRAAMLGTMTVFVAYPLMPGPWTMTACAGVLGLLLGCVQPMILSTLMRITPDARHGEALAVRSMTINASSALMPLTYGAIGAVVGVKFLFWTMGSAVGLGNWVAQKLKPD